MKAINYIISAIFMILVGCQSDTDLGALAKRERASGVIQDSLFLGLKFGMEKQEFFDHCRKINREGLVTHGTENMSVMYLFEDAADQKIAFNFYPKFKNNKKTTRKTNADFCCIAEFGINLIRDGPRRQRRW